VAGTCRRQLRPGSPSPLGHSSPWNTAQKSAHVGICPLSILKPSPPPSRSHSACHGAAYSGGRDAPEFVVSRPCTISICRPLGVRMTVSTFQSVHGRSSVHWTLFLVIWCLSLGQVSCFRLCPSACSRNVWRTCQSPVQPLLQSSLWRSAWQDWWPRCIFARVSCSLGLLCLVSLAISLLIPTDSWLSLDPVVCGFNAVVTEGPPMLVDCIC